jgi:hypothetical protein
VPNWRLANAVLSPAGLLLYTANIEAFQASMGFGGCINIGFNHSQLLSEKVG